MARDNILSFNLEGLLADKEAAYEFLREYTGLAIADTIRNIRDHYRLTQEDLARILGTTQSAVARLEDEEYRSYSLTTLTKIAEAFGLWPTVTFEPYQAVLNRTLRNVGQTAWQEGIEVGSIEVAAHEFKVPEAEAGSRHSALEPIAVMEHSAAA